MEFKYRAVHKGLAPPIPIPYSVDIVTGAILSELEMKKIRKDIDDAVPARIPVLDDNQSREMIVERGLALQESRGLPVSEERLLEERIYTNVEERFAGAVEKMIAASLEKITTGALEKITASTLEKRMSMSIERLVKMSEMGEHSLVPFSQVRLEKIDEVVPSPNEAGREEKQIDLMELPDANQCGEKRKSVSPARQDANESTFENAKKKAKIAYTCDLCQVSATSQDGLDSHIRGKKHKLKVASSKLQNEKKDIDDDLLRPNKKAKGDDDDVSEIKLEDVLPQDQDQIASGYADSGTFLQAGGDADAFGIKLKDVLSQEQTASEYPKSGTFLLAKGDVDVTGIELKGILPKEPSVSEYKESGTFFQAKGDPDVSGIKLKVVLPQEQAASEYKGDAYVSGIKLKDVSPQEHAASEDTKSGTVLLSKGDADVSGTNLKDVLPQEQAASELKKSSDPKKTSAGGWICELCQVSMTSKIDFNTHMQGKKHKSKEAAALKLETKRKHLNESMPTNEAEKQSVGENDTSLLQGCEKIDSGEDDFKSSQHEKYGLLFWCKTCNVGANSEVGMETHRKGKKHAQKVLKAASKSNISNNVVVASDNLTKGGELDLFDNDTSEDDSKSSQNGKQGMVHAQEVLKTASTNKVSNNVVVVVSDNLTKVGEDLCDFDTSEVNLTEGGKKGMVFWCKTCNVGANSEVVMETHWKGKKHAKEVRKAASINKISKNVVAGDDPMNGGVWDEDDVRSSV